MHGHQHQCRALGSGIQRLELRHVLVHAFACLLVEFSWSCVAMCVREREREVVHRQLYMLAWTIATSEATQRVQHVPLAELTLDQHFCMMDQQS